MTTTVDARGFSCPQPVIMAREAISENDFPIEVLVDTVTSRENVRRMAQMQGCKVEAFTQGDDFKMIITK